MAIFFLALVMGVIFFPHSDITLVLITSVFSLICLMSYCISIGVQDEKDFFQKLKNLEKIKRLMVMLSLVCLIPLFFSVWIQSLIFPERKEVMKK